MTHPLRVTRAPDRNRRLPWAFRPELLLVPLLLVLPFTTGCAYFNTFYNARKSFNEGLLLKEQNQQVQAKAKFDKAIEKSARVVQRWPNSRWVDDALFLIGRSYYETGQYGRAVRQFDGLLLAFPKSRYTGPAALWRARAMLGEKRFAEAMLALAAVRRDWPREADAAAYTAALALIENGDTERGLDSLSVLLKRSRRSRWRTEALKLLADARFDAGSYAEAERNYREYLRAAPDPRRRAEAQLRLAAALLEQNKAALAARTAREVVGRYPQLDDQANLLLGRALAALGRTDEAVTTWRSVRGQNEYGAEAMFRIGRHFEASGDLATARACYDTARLRRPESVWGINAARRGLLVEALDARNNNTRPADEALFLLAEAYNAALGEYQQALELYGRVSDSFPDSPFAAQALLAQAWILRTPLRDSAAAEPLLRRLITTYPDSEYADEARRWLGLPVPLRPTASTARPERADSTPPTRTPPEPPPPPTQPEPKPEQLQQPPGQSRKAVEPDRTRSAADTTRPALVRLLPLYFDTDSASLRSDQLENLRRNARLIQDSITARIRLVGHCDPRGSESYNLTLGRRRAETVRDSLIAAGISPDRLETASEGERRPVTLDPQQYELNRRVEFELR